MANIIKLFMFFTNLIKKTNKKINNNNNKFLPGRYPLSAASSIYLVYEVTIFIAAFFYWMWLKILSY